MRLEGESRGDVVVIALLVIDLSGLLWRELISYLEIPLVRKVLGRP